MEFALDEGQFFVVRGLLGYGIPCDVQKLKRTIVPRLIKKGDMQLLRWLLSVDTKGLITSMTYPDTSNESSIPVANWASRCGNLEAQKLLLQNGASITLKDANGNTALHDACAYGHLRMVEYLVGLVRSQDRLVYISEPNRDDVNAFEMAVINGHLEIVEFLYGYSPSLSRMDKKGSTPLMKCIGVLPTVPIKDDRGHVRVAGFLFEKLGDPKLEFCPHIMGKLWKDGRMGMIKWLIEKGLDVNAKFQEVQVNRQTTLVDVAVQKGDWEFFKWLVDRGGDLNMAIGHLDYLSVDNVHLRSLRRKVPYDLIAHPSAWVGTEQCLELLACIPKNAEPLVTICEAVMSTSPEKRAEALSKALPGIEWLCEICGDSLFETLDVKQVVVDECHHLFHENCLKEFIGQGRSECPITSKAYTKKWFTRKAQHRLTP